jgi:hypothetical protein
MKPQLGDTILNRYTLVSSLREEPGIQAWKANDRVLAKDCQLFIITDRSAFAAIDELAGRIAATRPDRVIPILKYRMESDVLLIVMPVDSGQCLTDYMVDTAKPLSYSAIRSIIGECADVLREVIADTPSGIVITTDTVRVTTSGVQIADAPCATMLADTSATDLRTDGPERYAIRQLAALLYTLLTRTPSQATPTFNLRALPQDTPGEFRVICKRGLALSEPDDHTLPMAALVELDALLGNWKPLSELSDADIALPSVESDCSITKAILKPANETDIVPIPSTLINSSSLPELSITPSLPVQTAAVPAPHAMSPVPLPDGSSTADGNQSQSDARRLFDFNLSDAWEHENLSGEGTGDWYSEMNPAPIGGPGDNTRLTVPIVTGGIPDATVGETTSRIPVFDASGRAVAPGEESLRALEEEQARIAEVSAIPPSFTPKDVPDDEVDSKLPDEHLFGKLSTKVVAIIVALILVVAVHAFRSSGDNPADASSNSSEGDWPDINADAVPFGGSENATNGGTTDDSSKSSDATQSESKDSASDKSKKSETADSSSKKSGDKDSSAVPQPSHENNTAFTISSANFLSNPGGQSGYAYYMHLDQPQDAYRMVITIRTSGGKGYIRANTTGDPTQGKQVAEFTFAEGGTTEVKFTKAVKTQDLLLWVPSDSLPQNQLYIEKVEVF